MNFELETMRFTASVMGNPEYLKAVKGVKQAADRRKEGIERVNGYHAKEHEKRVVQEVPRWCR